MAPHTKIWISLKDRGRSLTCFNDLGIPASSYGVAESAEEALVVANKVGYPVLVRPSYVLGGQGMSIVIMTRELERAVIKLLKTFRQQSPH